MRYVEAQFLNVFAMVLYRHAEIVSGAYKLRDVEQGCKGEDGRLAFRPMSDEEKLKYSMSIMQAQIDRLRETTEFIGEHPQHAVDMPLLCKDCGDLSTLHYETAAKSGCTKPGCKCTGFNWER